MKTQQHPKDLLQLLRLSVNKQTAIWTCDEQAIALDSVLAAKQDLLVVLKTGGGKSVLFIAPALKSPDKVVLVLSPLNAIIQDLHKAWSKSA